jgi:MarR family transcriptional regulator, multiple antibiotic resistance protein MarR
MVRNRSTVKTAQPGLFLQPHILSQLVGTLIQRVVEGSGITASEYALTSWLNVIGQATPSRLADDLGMSATTLSAMIERLVAKGEVRRVPNAEDARSYLLDLTPKGKATNARNGQRLSAELRGVHGELEGDPEEILAAMRVLESALRSRIADS